jgi:hypothetical protein
MIEDKRGELEECEALLHKIEAARNFHLDIAALGFPSKLPFKAVSLRELLIHRVADLAKVAVEQFRSGGTVPAVLATRAVIETTAILAALRMLVTDVIQEQGYKPGHDATLMKLLFGSKTGNTPEEAINVLTQVEKLNKKFDGVRWWYDQLSEFAHPNHDGLLGCYAIVHRQEFMVDLGANESSRTFGEKVGLPALLCTLEIFALYFDELAQTLPEFAEICHAVIVAPDKKS